MLRLVNSLEAPVLIPVMRTICGPASSSKASGASTSSDGASFTGLTVSTNASLAAAPFVSVTRIVIVATPNWFAAGVTTTERPAPVPVNTTFPFGTKVGFDDDALTTRAASGVSTSPIVNTIAGVLESSRIVRLPTSVTVGASFTAFTVTTNESLAVTTPSLTVNVIVAEPDWFVAGTMRTVRLLPLPPNWMFAFGISAGFDDAADNVNPVATVSTSPIVTASGPKTESSFINCDATSPIVGASFTAEIVNTNALLTTDPAPSVTVRVIVTEPLAFGAGDTVRKRFAPEPDIKIFAGGTTAGFELNAPSTKPSSGVSASPTVKAIGPNVPSSLIARFEIACNDGNVFPTVTLVAELFARFGSMLDDDTTTTFVCGPTTIARARIVTVPPTPAFSDPNAQDTLPPT